MGVAVSHHLAAGNALGPSSPFHTPRAAKSGILSVRGNDGHHTALLVRRDVQIVCSFLVVACAREVLTVLGNNALLVVCDGSRRMGDRIRPTATANGREYATSERAASCALEEFGSGPV